MTDAERTADDREPTQEERAIETINAIFAGGDLTAETMKLSNQFTDRQSSRVTSWFRRSKPRG